MSRTGIVRKMMAVHGPTVSYSIQTEQGPYALEPHLGQRLQMKATGKRTCVVCGVSVKKFYGQGFCFPCFRSAPEASECIIRPELCKAHEHQGRNVDWELANHAQEHIVYLSRTSASPSDGGRGGVKVGVTRTTQTLVRWIDQGAVEAVVLARVPYRYLAGMIEVELKKHFVDRTNWRHMLRKVHRDPEEMDSMRKTAIAALSDPLLAYIMPDEGVVEIEHPVHAYPEKVRSVNLDKTPEVDGTLIGIKGQYLIWADGSVLNVRNHTGFHFEMNG